MSRLTKPTKYEVLTLLVMILMLFGLAIAFAVDRAEAHVTECSQVGVPEGGGCLEPLEEGPMGLTNNDPEHVLCYEITTEDGPGSSAGQPRIDIVPCPPAPTPTPTPTPTPPSPTPPPEECPLPCTGIDSQESGVLALGLIGAGAVAVFATGRRDRKREGDHGEA